MRSYLIVGNETLAGEALPRPSPIGSPTARSRARVVVPLTRSAAG